MVVDYTKHGAIYNLAKAISNSSTFQTATGAANEAAAFALIDYPYSSLGSVGNLSFPLVIIDQDQREDVDDGGSSWRSDQSWYVSFGLVIAAAQQSTHVEQWQWFFDTMQNIWKEVRDVAGQDISGFATTFPRLVSIGWVEPPYPWDPSEISWDDDTEGPQVDTDEPVWAAGFLVRQSVGGG